MNEMKIVFATGNGGKLREAQEILGEGFELVTPAQIGLEEDIPETGETLRANSLMKAKYIYDHAGCNCFADDTGLEVEILKGAPGVHTARFAGEAKDPDANMARLLFEMGIHEHEASVARSYGLNTVHATRRARFRTSVTLILDGKPIFFDGTLEGHIALQKTGGQGFGYDPVFVPERIPAREGQSPDEDGLVANAGNLTIAQLSDDEKNAISHRGKAMRAMAEYLKK